MKSMKVINNQQINLNKQPQIFIIGSNKQQRTHLLEKIITDQNYYSNKYGRILYYTKNKYKSAKIIQDNQNTRQSFIYQNVIDDLDNAKKDKIINILLVIDSQIDIASIQKIFGMRYTYLDGLISFLIVINQPTQFPKQLFCNFNTFFVLQNRQMDKIYPLFKLQKRKKRIKQIFVFTQNEIYLIDK